MPYPDYADIICDELDHEYFNKNWLEKIQYNLALATTGVIRGTSRERAYNELGIEPLADRRLYRKTTSFIRL